MMNHRHLLPDEIDQLLDGEVGFSVAPLQAHLRECAPCQASYDEARMVVDQLEHLPRLVPAVDFADRVMASVQVYEPWHVAAKDAVAAWMRPLAPRSQPARLTLAAAGLSLAAVFSVATVWLLAHLDAVVFFGGVVRGNLVHGIGGAGANLAEALLGRSAAQALGHNAGLVLVASIGLYLFMCAAAVALLRAAAVSRRRRA